MTIIYEGHIIQGTADEIIEFLDKVSKKEKRIFQSNENKENNNE